MSLFKDVSPIGTFNYAHSFLGAAKALDRLEWEGRETHPRSPTEFLCWHSIELFFKAFLLADGIELSKLRSREFGHNITALASEAKRRGLKLSSKDDELLSFMPFPEDMIDLRYLKVGMRTLPESEEVEETCQNLYRSVGIELKRRGHQMGSHEAEISDAEYGTEALLADQVEQAARPPLVRVLDASHTSMRPLRQ